MRASTPGDRGAILRAIAGIAVGCATLLAAAAPAAAQSAPHPTTSEGETPALPQGAATIRGTVLDHDLAGATGHLTVALYALLPDGRPGLDRTTTTADGSFVFANVSSEAGIVYLLGVEYRGVPYGER